MVPADGESGDKRGKGEINPVRVQRNISRCTPEEVNGAIIDGLGSLQTQTLQRTPPTVVPVTGNETLGSDASSGSEFPMSGWFSVIPSEELASAPGYDSVCSLQDSHQNLGSQIHRGEQKTRTTTNQCVGIIFLPQSG